MSVYRLDGIRCPHCKATMYGRDTDHPLQIVASCACGFTEICELTERPQPRARRRRRDGKGHRK